MGTTYQQNRMASAMSEKKEKIPTKRLLNSEGSWRARLRCLEATFLRRLKKDNCPLSLATETATDWLDLTSSEHPENPHWGAWIPAAHNLHETLKRQKNPLQGVATFYVEDYDALALEHCYAILAQICRSPLQVDLTKILRWASVGTESSGSLWENQLRHWRHHFLGDERIITTLRLWGQRQNSLFADVQRTHIISDGQSVLAVWEGRISEASFLENGLERLLGEDHLPHTVIFNQISADKAQWGICMPLVAKSPSSLRCLILLKNRQNSSNLSLSVAS